MRMAQSAFRAIFDLVRGWAFELLGGRPQIKHTEFLPHAPAGGCASGANLGLMDPCVFSMNWSILWRGGLASLSADGDWLSRTAERRSAVGL